MVYIKLIKYAPFIIILCGFSAIKQTPDEKIKFPAMDGVKITADYYKVNPDTVPLILLFHQAGWSRGEYIEIAPRLNRMGFNCLAVDLRSGNTVNNIPDETYQEAKRMMKETTYTAAETDIEASIEYAMKMTKGPIILWGSSYSASLVLKVAGENKYPIMAVIAFSPGEYFRPFGKSDKYITNSVSNLHIPVFITCTHSEGNMVRSIYNNIPEGNKYLYIPETEGHHGSSALWNIQYDSKYYWQQLDVFLKNLN